MTKMMFFTSLAVKFLINKFAFDLRRRKQVFNECTARTGLNEDRSSHSFAIQKQFLTSFATAV